jgi:subtilisin family serine protease
MRSRVLPLVLVLLGLILTTGCQSSTGHQVSNQCGHAETRFIVKAKSTIHAASITDKVASFQRAIGFQNNVKLLSENFFVVEFQNLAEAKEKLEELRNSAAVEYVEPDVRTFALETPSDPMFQNQWAHQKIQSIPAWDITHGSQNVVVAVIDTGVDFSHPDLQANMWNNPGEIPGNSVDDDRNGYVDDFYGYDFANGDPDPTADDTGVFHGTHTAGTVGAVGGNGTGIVGHAPVVKIMALKFLSGNGGGDVSDAIRAIDYAIANGAQIMNNSWGSEMPSHALSDAIGRAQKAGILFVAASGNGGSDGIGDNNDVSPSYPANYQFDNVISVASSNQNDELSRFSNFGASNVQIAAPGENILSTMNGARYQSMSGTSMASPLISGVLALMIARRPDLSYQQIKHALLTNVDSLSSLAGKVSSGGRVNALKALNAISNGPVPTPPPSTPKPPVLNQPASCDSA